MKPGEKSSGFFLAFSGTQCYIVSESGIASYDALNRANRSFNPDTLLDPGIFCRGFLLFWHDFCIIVVQKKKDEGI